jgi:hypothetical protein
MDAKKPISNKSDITPPSMANAKEKINGCTDASGDRATAVVAGLPGSAGDGRGRPSKAKQQAAEEQKRVEEEAEKLYSAENWEIPACAPFDLMFIATKSPRFDLIEKEARLRKGYFLGQILKIYGSKIDPKIMVLIAASLDYLKDFGGAIYLWQQDLKQMKTKETK